ncbi:MAG TPA: 4-(cytidine 5'-diphospho)-2-C-methyl-D-erythritol kinase [Jatrophihabitans sp.]|nr:4-(cytidine 5'-diphospho)-2-C-methyl-D-erythritol kinase [Jatrophihabitans sp.]
MSVTVRVPAKVNLHLSVGQRRADGYHELVNVFHAVDVEDEIVATPADELSLHVREAPAEVPADDRNLAWQAAALLAETAGVEPCARLELRKSIPVAGGMAGGSADAAAALVACARLWGVDADLPTLAGRLGADVAFALLGGTAVGTGRGEVLRPVPARGVLHWVFVFAGYGVSAGAAYAELDRLRDEGQAPEPIGAPDALFAALAAGDVAGIAADLRNDLQPAVLLLAPQLGATLDAGLDAGALAGVVSGSGPTCAFLCADADAAQGVAYRLKAAGLLARTARGPVPGASAR